MTSVPNSVWKFESVALDFRPDFVVDVRDWWHLEHQERSPFRPFFRWAIMPTVDAAPQADEWMATYLSADAVFSYSDWGLSLLEKQGGGRVKTVASAPPGADLVTLRPAPDKKAHKAQMGLPADALVVGTIMRNQKRKLYPDLISSFATFLRTAPPGLARRTYLYLHVSHPDVGWDIPALLREHGVGGRTLLTYACSGCGVSYPSFYQDARAHCRGCGEFRSMLPTTQTGVARSVLNNVLNFFDVYVQYASNEGFGMPQVEAAACGVHVMAVDYSAMSDVVRKLKGTPLAVLALARDADTGCDRAIPDNADLVAKLVRHLSLPESVRTKLGHDARKAAEAHYDYDFTAKTWMDHFDAAAVPDHSLTWDSPPRFHTPPAVVPGGMSDSQFVRWGITHLAGRPDLADGHLALRMMRDLQWESTVGNLSKSSFSELSWLGVNARRAKYGRDDAVSELMEMCGRRNVWEQNRADANAEGGRYE